MRQINWEDQLSEEDIAWLRQTGIPGIEDRITKHQEQYGADVPDLDVQDDEVTRSALDPNAGADSLVNTENGPQLVDPRKGDPQPEIEDDYDTWPKADLEKEVDNRNRMADNSDGTISSVEVAGTGSNGNVTKADLIKGLRLWDSENPEAIQD